jgi:hypothetical protein
MWKGLWVLCLLPLQYPILIQPLSLYLFTLNSYITTHTHTHKEISILMFYEMIWHVNYMLWDTASSLYKHKKVDGSSFWVSFSSKHLLSQLKDWNISSSLYKKWQLLTCANDLPITLVQQTSSFPKKDNLEHRNECNKNR